jgi:multicomponent Na+:H+ antiporter subunit D
MEHLSNNLLVLAPVLFPLIGAIVALIFIKRNMAQRYIGVVTTFITFVASGFLLYENWQIAVNQPDHLAVQIYRLGGWMPPYGIVLVADLLTSLFVLMATIVVFSGAVYIVSCKDKAITRNVFVPLFLFMATGLNGAFLTGDFFTMFIFIELMVMSSVVLTSISDDPLGLEAAIKYLLMSAMGTLFLLIAIAAIYASFGTLNMADVAMLLETGQRPLLASASAVMLMSAFLLKSAVVPFHFWQPDFHTTAPTPISSLLSSVVVKVGIYGIIRIVTLLFTEEAPTINNLLVALGIFGIFFGSFSALRTYHIKRMLAYSTLGQVGFILVGIGWGSELALVGAVVYAFNHALVKASLLQLSGIVMSYTKNKVGDFIFLTGVGKTLRAPAFFYLVGGLALAGIPPFNGFISKVALVRGGVDTEQWLTLGLVVGGGILTLLYMTRAYVLIFQTRRNADSALMKEPMKGDSVLAPAMLLTLAILIGIYARPLIEVAEMAVAQMMDTSQYINAVLGVLTP